MQTFKARIPPLRLCGNEINYIQPLEIKEEEMVGSQIMQEERTIYGRDHFSAYFTVQVFKQMW